MPRVKRVLVVFFEVARVVAKVYNLYLRKPWLCIVVVVRTGYRILKERIYYREDYVHRLLFDGPGEWPIVGKL